MDEKKTKEQNNKKKFQKDKLIIWAIIILVISMFILKQKRVDVDIPENLPVTESPVTEPSTAPAVSEKLPQLLDLGSTSCIPCKMMQPILEELTAEYKGQMSVKFVDIYKNPSIAEKYSVRTIPTQIFLDAGGMEISRNVGFIAKDDILARWKSLGYEFKKNPSPGKQDK